MALLKKENECHIVAHDPLCSERLNQRRQCEELKTESWELKDEFRAKHDAKLLDKPSFARDKESWSRLWPTSAPRKSSPNGASACERDVLRTAARVPPPIACCPKRAEDFWLVAAPEPSLTSRRWSEIAWEGLFTWASHGSAEGKKER